MVVVEIDHTMVVRLVLDYLRQTNCVKAMRALEEETSVMDEVYGEDLTFLRSLILDGCWEDAERFVEPFGKHAGAASGGKQRFDMDRVMFELRKQRFLELVDGKEFKPEVMELVQALKQLEGYCSKQEFNNLCYCLTLDRLSQHPAFTSWTPHLGRLAVFATIKPYFESVAASQWTTRSSAETTPVPRNQLLVLLKQAAAMQVVTYVHGQPQHGAPSTVKFNALSTTLEDGVCKRNTEPPATNLNTAITKWSRATFVTRPLRASPGVKGRQATGRDKLAQSFHGGLRSGVRGAGSGGASSGASPDRKVRVRSKVSSARAGAGAGAGAADGVQRAPVRQTSAGAALQQSIQQQRGVLKGAPGAAPLSADEVDTVRELLRRSMHSEAALRDNGGSGAANAPGSEEESGKSEPAGVGKEWEKPPGAEAKRGGMVWDIAWSPPPGAKAPPPAFAAAEQRRRSGGVPPPPASNPAGSDSAVRITRPPWRRDDAPPQPSVGGGAGGGAGADATSRPSSALRKSSSEGGGAGGSRSVRFAADEDASAKRPGKGRKKQTKKPKGGAKQALGPAPAPAKGTTLWHPDTLRCLQPHAIMPDAQPIRALCFDTRGSHMAVGTNSRALRILSLPTLKTSAAVADASGAAAATAPAAAATLSKLRVDFEWTGHHAGSLYCVDWSSDGMLIASGSNDTVVKVVRAVTWEDPDSSSSSLPIAVLQPRNTGTVRDLCFLPSAAPGSAVLATAGGGDFAVRGWEVERGEPSFVLRGHKGTVFAVSSWGRSQLVTGSGDGSACLWDVRAASVAATLSPCDDGEVHSIAIRPRSTDVAVSYASGAVAVWDTRKQAVRCSATIHTADCRSVDYSPDGSTILSTSFDTSVALLQEGAGSLAPVAVWKEHADKVLRGRWHPTIPAFATASADKTVLLWSVQP